MNKVESQKTIYSPTPGFLSLDHAAAYADVSVKTIKRWIERGLPKYQAGPGSKVLIRPGDIEQFLINKETKAPNINEMVKKVIQELHGSTAHTRPKDKYVGERDARY